MWLRRGLAHLQNTVLRNTANLERRDVGARPVRGTITTTADLAWECLAGPVKPSLDGWEIAEFAN
jgi:hypothetical protein